MVFTSVPAAPRFRTWHRIAALLATLAVPFAATALGLPAAPTFAAIGIGYGFWLKPRIAGRLDNALLLLISAMGLLLLPLPAAVVRRLTSSALADGGGWAVLAADPRATEDAILIAVGSLGVFWGARGALSAGGLRRTVLGLMTLGLLGFAALLAAATAGALTAADADALHLSAWAMLALPPTLGLLLGRLSSGRRAKAAPGSQDPQSVALAIWVGAGLLLVVEGSHGAAFSLSIAIAGAALLIARGRWLPRHVQKAGLVATAVLMAIGLADLSADGSLAAHSPLLGRAARAIPALSASDVRPALPVATGPLDAGHYAVFARDGGVFLVLPLLAVLVLVTVAARGALLLETSRTGRLVRAGAAVSLTALAVLSLWDRPLDVPGTAALTATLLAMLVHHREPGAAERVVNTPPAGAPRSR